MDHFQYINEQLYCESVPVHELADGIGTPAFVYSRRTFIDHLERLQQAFAALSPRICFSLKSCANLSIARLLIEHGAGMDLVSGGELHRALRAGVDPAECVFAGVGKTDDELRAGLQAGVGWMNVESEAELERLRAVAASLGVRANAALRINPDIDAHTHRHTTTGVRETKFGVDFERAAHLFTQTAGDPHVELAGLHVHIGSPVLTVDPYLRTLDRVLGLMDDLAARGIVIRMLDLGGGFGADYETDEAPVAKTYAEAMTPRLLPYVQRGVKIVLEPGRTIAANAGILLVRVLYVKTSGMTTFVIVDGGMNVLLRPSHYDAFHFIWPARTRKAQFVPMRRTPLPDINGLQRVDVVGPICETGDFLARDRALPPVERGDVLAVFGAGAYGMTMASRYNAQPLPVEVMVDGHDVQIIRRRETYDDLIAHELTPVPVDVAAGVTP